MLPVNIPNIYIALIYVCISYFYLLRVFLGKRNIFFTLSTNGKNYHRSARSTGITGNRYLYLQSFTTQTTQIERVKKIEANVTYIYIIAYYGKNLKLVRNILIRYASYQRQGVSQRYKETECNLYQNGSRNCDIARLCPVSCLLYP